MENVSLIFDRHHAFLGEVALRGGVCCNFVLTAEGDRQLGAHMTEWQTRGIPMVRTVDKDAFFQERVLMRDAHFLEALTEWGRRHGMGLVGLSRQALECWEMLSRLPLEPNERFAMIVAIRAASVEQLAEWREVLAKATEAVVRESQTTSDAVAKVWQQAAKDLAGKFGKKG